MTEEYLEYISKKMSDTQSRVSSLKEERLPKLYTQPVTLRGDKTTENSRKKIYTEYNKSTNAHPLQQQAQQVMNNAPKPAVRSILRGSR
jgi:hypothetical protein